MRIAIDGPAGSGKSTVARELSIKLSLPYLETGLAYRAAGYLLFERYGRLESVSWDMLEPLLGRLEIEPKVGGTEVRADGRRLNEELRDEEVGRLASLVGTLGEFREYINSLFREIIGSGQAVVEGRDAGTNIIPDADLKLFITATPEERARRRYEQLRRLGREADYETILEKILERDNRDINRKDYPFKPAPDAIVVDTTGKDIEEVLREVLSIVESKRDEKSA
ncbi:(d)CMP kinase [Hydrogenivirga sp.]